MKYLHLTPILFLPILFLSFGLTSAVAQESPLPPAGPIVAPQADTPQLEAPRAGSPTAGQNPTAKTLVMQAYAKTSTAADERDYAQIIAMLDQALASDTLIEAHRKYAQQLKGWS